MEAFNNVFAFTAIESVLRIFAYLTVIVVGCKGIRALNIYIDKNK